MVCGEANEKIVAYQLRVNRGLQRVVFVAQVLAPLSDDEKISIVRKASHISGMPERSIVVVESSELEKAPSGKIKLVIEEK